MTRSAAEVVPSKRAAEANQRRVDSEVLATVGHRARAACVAVIDADLNDRRRTSVALEEGHRLRVVLRPRVRRRIAARLIRAVPEVPLGEAIDVLDRPDL